MKHLLPIILLVFMVNLVFAEELKIPRPLDKDGKLTHGIAVCTVNKAIQTEFTNLFLKKLGDKRNDINIVSDLNAFPDLAFLFEANEEEILQARQNGIFPVIVHLSSPKNGKTSVPVIQAADCKGAAAKAAAFVEKMYYQGMRPQNSVVFRNETEGHLHYRIPSVLTLPNGNIIAITEAREDSKDCAENDIVLKISKDQGKSWGPMITVAESGQASLNNPTSVYIEEQNRIIILYQEYPPKLDEGKASAGLEGGSITRTYVSVSDDGGETWQPRRDITREVKLPNATGYASGPGIGIRVASGPDKGRIIIPLNASGGKDGWFNYLVYSDDKGETWHQLPGRSSYGTNESQIVQVSDTGFLINARCHRFPGNETIAPAGWNPWNFGKVTRFRGMIPVGINGTHAQWNATQTREDMPDPLCQGTILRYSGLKPGEKSRILFANPASRLTEPRTDRRYESTPPARINGTVRISYDETDSWSYAKRIYGNRFTEYQYSVLTNLGGGKIGCLFEVFPEIRFAVFDMAWLTSGEDKGKK